MAHGSQVHTHLHKLRIACAVFSAYHSFPHMHTKSPLQVVSKVTCASVMTRC